MLVASAAALLVPAGASGQLASRPAAEWIKMLDAPERLAGLQIEEIVGRLALKTGDVVADLGAGTGAFSLPMARVVSPGGRVYAVEVEQGLVDYVRDKAKAQNVTNVASLLGQFTDPALPTRDVDLAFFHDALHHIADRTGYLAALVTYLKPTARVAIVEMDPVTGPHRNDPTLQITKDQLNTWMATLGYQPQQVVDISGTKWLAVYARR
ncbi:MAG: methyltransferase domain-containing protein [Vicinamibacterales bacterium]